MSNLLNNKTIVEESLDQEWILYLLPTTEWDTWFTLGISRKSQGYARMYYCMLLSFAAYEVTPFPFFISIVIRRLFFFFLKSGKHNSSFNIHPAKLRHIIWYVRQWIMFRAWFTVDCNPFPQLCHISQYAKWKNGSRYTVLKRRRRQHMNIPVVWYFHSPNKCDSLYPQIKTTIYCCLFSYIFLCTLQSQIGHC